jgi:hypothetical protein
MDLAATLFSSGWASGVNSYATVLVLALLGRSGVAGVPEELQSDPVLFVAAGMYAVEFVADKVPLLDNAWDAVHTFIRPAVGGMLGFAFTGDAGVSQAEELFGAGGSSVTALASHSVKAGLRLGINASPEPVSNILTSLTEDGLVAVVAFFAIENPELAAAIAALLLALGIGAVVFLWRRIRAALARRRERRRARDG